MSLSNQIQWISLGYDCWRIVFFNLTFQELQKIRLVCSSWNKWIIEFKPFWPIGNH